MPIKVKEVNGMKVGDWVESADWQRSRWQIISFSQDKKTARVRNPFAQLAWMPVDQLRPQSDEPRNSLQTGSPTPT